MLNYPRTPRYELYVEFSDDTEPLQVFSDDMNSLVFLYYQSFSKLAEHRIFSASISRNDEENKLLCSMDF